MRGALGVVVVAGLVVGVGCKDEFGEYQRKGKATEYKLNLNKLSRNVKIFHVRSRELPATNGGPTPPAGSCCAGPNHKCAPNEALWTEPPWPELEFEVLEPHYYSYQYERVAPDRAVLRAYGDLDCDENISVYEMTVTIVNDMPQESEPVEKAPE